MGESEEGNTLLCIRIMSVSRRRNRIFLLAIVFSLCNSIKSAI